MQEWKTDTRSEKEINIWRIGGLLLKRAWVIGLVALVFGFVTYFYSAVIVVPTYRAGFSAYVNNHLGTEDKNNTSSGDLVASKSLVYVYKDVITSRSVLNAAAEKCGVPLTTVMNGVTTSVSDTAAFLQVYVETTDPALSLALAEVIAQEAPIKVAEVVEGSSMRIIDEPVMPKTRYSPDVLQNTLIGLATGALLSALALVVIDLTYDIVQDPEELEKRYDIVVIGYIPDITQAEKESQKYRKIGESQR